MADEQAIIQDVMEENDITSESIPREVHIKNFTTPGNIRGSRRYFNTKGFARFQPHRGCSRRWGSAHSWSVMDLKRQKFRHHFGQGCQKCDATVQPEYDEEAIRCMAEWACKEHLIRMGLQEREPRFDMQDLLDGLVGDPTAGPHDEARCGMCKQLGHACWK